VDNNEKQWRILENHRKIIEEIWQLPSEIVLFDSPWAPIDKADEAPLLAHERCRGER